jgi:ABC-type multidrug transport system permease subunit
METNQRDGHGGMWAMWICLALFALLVLSFLWR